MHWPLVNRTPKSKAKTKSNLGAISPLSLQCETESRWQIFVYRSKKLNFFDAPHMNMQLQSKKSKLIFRGVELPPRSVQSVKDQLYSFNATATPTNTVGCKWSTLLSQFRGCLAKIGSQHPHIQIPLLLNGVSKSAPLLSLPAALLLTVLPPGIFLTHKSKAISYNTWFTKFSSRICNDTHQILAQRQVFFAFIGFTATSSSYWIIWVGWY